jgi:hypothetical protein
MTEEEPEADPAGSSSEADAGEWPLAESQSEPTGPAESVPDDMDPADEPFADAVDRVRSADDAGTQTASADSSSEKGRSGTAGQRSGPMSDLAMEIEERRETVGDASEHFDQEDVEVVDPDVVWEQLRTDEPIDASTDVERERDSEVVDAGAFCERCEYFSSPPEVRCTHDGTDIAELVDVGQFRVLDCPKVSEERQLEEL